MYRLSAMKVNDDVRFYPSVFRARKRVRRSQLKNSANAFKPRRRKQSFKIAIMECLLV